MVSKLDIGQCASENARPSRRVDCKTPNRLKKRSETFLIKSPTDLFYRMLQSTLTTIDKSNQLCTNLQLRINTTEVGEEKRRKKKKGLII